MAQHHLAHAFLALALVAAPAVAQQQPSGTDDAAAIFREAHAICASDEPALWGTSLCGPMLLVDPESRSAWANQPDRAGALKPLRDGIHGGTLPRDVLVANTSTDWSGVHWTELVLPLPDDKQKRDVLLGHEMFHRIQEGLGLSRQAEGGNRHLDTLEGRYLLQLEWRALGRALRAREREARNAAIADAIDFRHERYRRFPDAAAQEWGLEVNEGLAEYTGVRVGLGTPAARTDYALHDLEAFLGAPTFVRSFAYAGSPAYGLLLDAVDPAWRSKAGATRFDELLASALHLSDRTPEAVAARMADYDDGSLRASETARAERRRAELDGYRQRLVQGPVLIVPLQDMGMQFNPQTLAPLEGEGMVYPTIKLTGRWGLLEVESGGMLLRDTPRVAVVSAAGSDVRSNRGPGWTLTLKPGWRIVAGERNGDFRLACASGCAPDDPR